MKRSASIFILSICLSNYVLSESCDEEISQLFWLENADAKSDAQNSIKQGNLKYLAIYGYALYIPGIGEKSEGLALNTKNYNAIEGTTDGLCNEAHGDFVSLAHDYASIYNKIIMQAK